MKKPLLRQILPSHVGFFPRASKHRVNRSEGAEQDIFNYCIRGKGWCELGRHRFEVGAGDLLVVPRETPHAYGSYERHPWTVYWFHVMGEQVDLLLNELSVSRLKPVVRLGNHPALVGLFDELRQTLEHDYSPPQLLYASQLLTHLMGLMIRLRFEAVREIPGARERVMLTVAYMQEHLEEPFDLDSISAMSGISVSHCSLLFRKITGYAPKNYLNRLRIHRAAQLLNTSALSMEQIARRVGFSDPLYFSKVFRSINGTAPSRYRQRVDQPARADEGLD